MRQVMMAVLVIGLVGGVVGCAGPKPVFRVNAGADKEYTDAAGAKWSPDQEFTEGGKYGAIGGKAVRRTTVKIPEGTKAPEVYLTERYGKMTYRFAVPNGKYTVRLHFAETYDGIKAEGERVFSVKINGQPALTDFDVLKAAGGFAKPIVKEFKGVQVADGKLLIEFAEKTQSPEVNGIEILVE